MKRGLSDYLNLLRAFSAIAVVLAHLDYRGIGGHAYAWFRTSEIGHQAVMVFFVLSGYVIALTAERTRTLLDFAVARLARMYSVVVPLILAAPVLYLFGRSIEPGIHAQTPGFYDTPHALSAIHTLTFTQELWFTSHRYFGDVPLWSLGYEVAYYALFGLAFYLRGTARRIGLLLCIVLIGPKILLLMPVWLLGVAVYRHRARLRVSRAGGAAIMVLSLALYALYFWLHQPVDRAVQNLIAAQGISPHGTLGWSKQFLTDYWLGLIVALHVIGAAGWFTDGAAWPGWLSAVGSWLADRSFSLYVFHMPVLYVIAAMLGDLRATLAGGAVMFDLTLLSCFAIAPLTDLRKREWQALLMSVKAPVTAFLCATRRT